MTAYVIVYGSDPTDGLASYALSTRYDAYRIAADRTIVPIGGCAYIVEDERDVLALNPKLVMALYNGLCGDSVTRFATTAVMVQRFLAALAQVSQSVTTIEGDITVSETEEKTKSTKTWKEIDLNKTIRVLAEKNPKRGKAAERFALYSDGMTVADARKAGVRSIDVHWDIEHQFIELMEPQHQAA